MITNMKHEVQHGFSDRFLSFRNFKVTRGAMQRLLPEEIVTAFELHRADFERSWNVTTHSTVQNAQATHQFLTKHHIHGVNVRLTTSLCDGTTLLEVDTQNV